MIAIVAISAGALTLNLAQFTGFNGGAQKTGAMMLSNVEAVVMDEAGNIIAYRQGDNHIVESGMIVLAQQTFGPGNAVGGSNNTNATDPDNIGGQVRFMEIGNGNGTGNCPGLAGTPILGWANQTLQCNKCRNYRNKQSRTNQRHCNCYICRKCRM